jgi:hypothetical protein
MAWLPHLRWCPIQQAQQAQLHISDCNSDSPIISNVPPELEVELTLRAPCLCEPAQQTPRRPHILIVESNTMCQQLLCRVLRAADCECTAVGTAVAAAELLLSERYSCDLMFMAVHTPVMSA